MTNDKELFLSQWLIARTTEVIEEIVKELNLDVEVILIIGMAEHQTRGLMVAIQHFFEVSFEEGDNLSPHTEALMHIAVGRVNEDITPDDLVEVAKALIRTYFLDFCESVGESIDPNPMHLASEEYSEKIGEIILPDDGDLLN